MNREAFEKWAKPLFFHLSWRETDEYEDLIAQAAWMAWQRVSETNAEQIRLLRETLAMTRTAFASIANGIPDPTGYAAKCAAALKETES